VRVTDFGLVVLASGGGEERTGEPSRSGDTPLTEALTRTGLVVGTPNYMAPEQFAGKPATARSDQFAFCVALHEALYGHRPFAGTTTEAIAIAVQEGNVLPPPVGTKIPSWLRRVVLRGLAVAESERYSSMHELLAALGHDPGRRARWIGVGAASCLAIAGLVVVLRPQRGTECDGGGSRSAEIWTAERRIRMQAAFGASGRAHAAASFAHSAQLLDAWTEAWKAGYREACEATHVRGEQSEHVLDLRMQCLTRALHETGATIDLLVAGSGDAVDHAVTALLALPPVSRCDATAVSAAVPPPEDATTAAGVAQIRARLDDARGLDRLGRYREELALLEPEVATSRSLHYPPALAEALVAIGKVEFALDDRSSTDSLREAMLVATRAGDSSTALEATAYLVLALAATPAHHDAGHEIAALADAQAERTPPPIETAVRLDLSIGYLAERRTDYATARTRFEQALARAKKELGPDHPQVTHSMHMLGELARVQGRFKEAEQIAQTVVELREREVGKDHPDYANALNDLAVVYRAEDKHAEAKQLYERVLAIRIATYGADHPEVAAVLKNLANVYADEADDTRALELAQRMVSIYEHRYSPDSFEVAEALDNLGTVYATKGDYVRARASAERALAVLERVMGPEHPRVAMALSNLGTIAQGESKYDEAAALYQRAINIAESKLGAEHPDVADYLTNLGGAQKQLGKLVEASASYARAIAIAEKTYGPEHTHVAMLLTNHSHLQYELKDYAGALASAQQAQAIFEARYGKDHVYVAYSLTVIGSALVELGRPREAVPVLERSLAICLAASGDSPIAETRLAMADALIATKQSRARAVELARASLADYQHRHDEGGAALARQWLASH
jgi:tetratricopeptide (TPR) repeat protein